MARTTTIRQFRVRFPEGWEDHTTYYFTGPDVGGAQHRLTLTIDRNAMAGDVHEYGRRCVDELMVGRSDDAVMSEQVRTLPDDTRTYEAEISTPSPERNIVIRKYVYLLIKGVGYTFTVDYTSDVRDSIVADVDKIVDSFAPSGD